MKKKMIAMPNLNSFVHYSKVYDQDYEKYKSMEEFLKENERPPIFVRDERNLYC